VHEIEEKCSLCKEPRDIGTHGRGFCAPSRKSALVSRPSDMYHPLVYFDPEVTLLEPRMDTSLGGFAKAMFSEQGVRVVVPDTECRGWMKSLYKSGPAIAQKMSEDFFKYETDMYLFGNSCRMIDVFGLMLQYIKEVPLLSWVHSCESMNPPELEDLGSRMNNITNWMKSEKVFCTCEYLRNQIMTEASFLSIEKHQDIASKIQILPIGYNYKRLDDFVRRKPRTRERPTVAWIGRLDYDRRPAQFARMVLEAAKSDDSFDVMLFCKPLQKRLPIWKEMVEFFQERGRLLHYGFAPEEKFGELLSNIDIVLTAYYSETFGFACGEAVYLGSLIVAPNDAVYPELYPKQFLYDSEKDGVGKLLNLFRKIRENDIGEEYTSLLPIRRRLRSEFDSGQLQGVYAETFREIWLRRMSTSPSKLAPSSLKAVETIRANGGELSKRKMMEAVGWSTPDWYYGLRYRLLFNGFRTKTVDGEVVWYEQNGS